MQYILHMFIYIYSCSERETGREGQTRLSVCNKFLAHPQHAQLISSHRIASHLVAIVIVIIIILIWNFHISFHLVRP